MFFFVVFCLYFPTHAAIIAIYMNLYHLLLYTHAHFFFRGIIYHFFFFVLRNIFIIIWRKLRYNNVVEREREKEWIMIWKSEKWKLSPLEFIYFWFSSRIISFWGCMQVNYTLECCVILLPNITRRDSIPRKLDFICGRIIICNNNN